jgi:MFS family permease
MLDLFHLFVAGHIMSGAIGLVAFWVPVLGRKGGDTHKRWGRVFTVMMLITGSFAIAISLTTLADPLATHPHLPENLRDPLFIRAIFGWMMLYLAILTINLAWYGWMCVTLRRDHPAMRRGLNLWLQPLLTLAAANCAWHGVTDGQILMVGMSVIGFATVGTNLWFMVKPQPRSFDWQLEHIKALVGAGISVYTAFFAFGAVRLMPALALNPVLWAIPLIVGLALILYHRHQVARRYGPRAPSHAQPA